MLRAGYASRGCTFTRHSCVESEKRGKQDMEHTCKSEVACQLEQIKQEHEAAQRGLSGLAQGTTRHAFISAKMQRMRQIHEELQRLVGTEQAIRLVAETLQAHTGGGDTQETGLPTTAE